MKQTWEHSLHECKISHLQQVIRNWAKRKKAYMGGDSLEIKKKIKPLL